MILTCSSIYVPPLADHFSLPDGFRLTDVVVSQEKTNAIRSYTAYARNIALLSRNVTVSKSRVLDVEKMFEWLLFSVGFSETVKPIYLES